MSQPNLDSLWMTIYGGYGYDAGALTENLSTASGLVFGTNPPYALTDFLAMYPKFGAVAEGSYTGSVPQAALQMFITLASASLQQARWREAWQFGMALFVAHYATLYLESEGSAATLPGQIAATGLAKGIKISQSAGDVSISYQVIQGFEKWGEFQRTTYGQQLISRAKCVGIGPIFVL